LSEWSGKPSRQYFFADFIEETKAKALVEKRYRLSIIGGSAKRVILILFWKDE